MRPQPVPTLATAHLIDVTAPIKLWTTFTQPKNWTSSNAKTQASAHLINTKPLDLAPLIFNPDR
jgi:hypothetical protein